MHIVTFGWKLPLAIIPPSTLIGQPLTLLITLIIQCFFVLLLRDVCIVWSCAVGGVPHAFVATIILTLALNIPDVLAARYTNTLMIILLVNRLAVTSCVDSSPIISHLPGATIFTFSVGLCIPHIVYAIYWGKYRPTVNDALQLSSTPSVVVALIFVAGFYILIINI
jgi:hypothetical protein